MGLVIGHIDLPLIYKIYKSGAEWDLEHDIPWMALAHAAYHVRGEEMMLISRAGVLLDTMTPEVCRDVVGYAYMLFDGGTLVVHMDGTVEHFTPRETSDEVGRWQFVYPEALTKSIALLP